MSGANASPTGRSQGEMIKVQHLSKSFGELAVLTDVNAEINRGEVVSIIGPSGAGKSTFLRCLNLLDRPTGGSIVIDGIDVLHRRTDVSKIRQKMNMVFQSFNLFAHLSVLDNLTLAPMKLRRLPRSAAERKAVQAQYESIRGILKVDGKIDAAVIKELRQLEKAHETVVANAYKAKIAELHAAAKAAATVKTTTKKK